MTESKIPQPGEEGYRCPAPGDQRFSRFFDSYIELEAYVHDNDYFFRVLDNPKYPPEKVWHNQARWTELPRLNPEGGPRSR